MGRKFAGFSPQKDKNKKQAKEYLPSKMAAMILLS